MLGSCFDLYRPGRHDGARGPDSCIVLPAVVVSLLPPLLAFLRLFNISGPVIISKKSATMCNTLKELEDTI